MKFSMGNILFLSSILLEDFIAANPLPPASIINRTYEPRLPFNFTELFTASLSIGNASSRIQIPGGVLLNEPVTGGTVTGPMINATIQGGFAHPPIYNGNIQVPVIDIYGVINDGEAFYIHETGIGSNNAQVTRIEIDIGGQKYAPLRNGFILASVNPTANRTTVNVKGYLVENTLA